MKNHNDIKSLPCKISKYEMEESDNGFYKAKVIIMHEGINRNNTKFEVENMKKAMETIKNRPLLAYIVYDKEGSAKDFKGHERVLKTVKKEEGKETYIYYLEQPIGLFPESCNPRFEEIDGVTHFVADCFIWEDYSNEAIELIFDADGEKQVSMEINVEDCEIEENNIVNITDYSYRAVTVLGDNAIQGMNGTAKLEVYTNTDEFISEFAEKITKKIQEFELHAKEGEEMQKNKNFGMGIEQIFKLITNVLSPITYKNRWGDDCSKYYVVDIDIAESIVILRDIQDSKYVGATFTLTETDVQVDLSSLKEYVSTWVERETLDGFSIYEEYTKNMSELEDKKIAKFESVEKELSKAKEKESEYTSEISKLEEKISELEEYKATAEADKEKVIFEKEMNEIDANFSFNEEEIKEFKEKVFSKEITIDEYKKELFALEGMKSIESKKHANNDNTVKGVSFSIAEVNDEQAKIKEAKAKAYNGLFEKYI